MSEDALRKPDVVTVAVSRVDGGLTIVRVVTTEYRPTTEEEKAEGLGDRTAAWTIDPTPEYVDNLIKQFDWQDGQKETSWRFVPNDFINEETDRIFRDAWKDEGHDNGPGHDMPKAREIHKERLRRKRANMLEDLDVAYMQADEAGNKKAKKEIAKKKQQLRDVTDHPSIEAATNIEQLEAAIPDALSD